MITGEAVLQERKRRGLSRTKFAQLVGLTPTKIGNIEKGREIRPEELTLLVAHVPDTATSSAPVTSEYTAIHLLDEDEELMLLLVPGSMTAESVAYPPPAPPLSSNAMTFVTSTPMDVVAPLQAAPTVEPGPTPSTSGPVGAAALYVNGLRRISNSEVQSFKRCRRQWWLAWFRGLQLAQERFTGALPLGDRVHRALAKYYVPPGVESRDPREALEDELAHDEARVLASVADREASDAATVMLDFKKDADMARAMIEGYVQWLAETGADQGYRVIAPEQQLSMTLDVPLRGGEIVQVLIVGRLDVRLMREHDQVRLFMDHKTCGSFETLVRKLIWDEQMKHYHLLEESNRSPESPPVDGALYNMLKKVKRSKTASPPFYQRVEIRRNRQEIENFRTRLVGETHKIIDLEQQLTAGADHQMVAYPTPGDHCLWGCDYSAICPMFDDGSRVEDFITEHYIEVNPLDRYNDETKESVS